MPHSISSASLQSAIGNLKSKLQLGGIAQLVERQLCKLEVRGSNPLASSLRSRRREERRLSRRSLGVGGHLFQLAPFFARATTRQASHDKILLRLYPPERNRTSEVLYRFNQ
jgi:hypothetical protein